MSDYLVYEFLSIHPYQDGNGRMSRLLTTLLLLQNGYDFMEYSSMEYEIEKRKAEYYRVLMDTQKHRGKNQELLGNWLLFFLDCLEKCILKLEDQYTKIRNKKGYLNTRQVEVIEFIKRSQPVKMNDLIDHLPQYTSYTLRKDVKYLVDERYLTKIGRGKATIYEVA
ncbi:Fic family protein [Neolewinella sp.]|uniref:Fic family protein n=1 Tax=Neolewinella sp. TaxID=2993543 RepID=UPI003B52A1BD